MIIRNIRNFHKVLAASSLSLLLLAPSMASAAGQEETGAALDDPSLTSQVQMDLQALALEKDIMLEKYLEETSSSVNANPDGEWYGINVTAYKQEKTYWCGPASARQTLSFHKGKSGSGTALPSQTTLSGKIGTTTSGSTTTGIASGLNAYAATYGYTGNKYVAANLKNLTNPLATFETRIKGVLKSQTNAPVILIQTKYLPRYNGVSIRHYNTVSAYSYETATGKKQIKMVDPHYNTAYYGVSWNPLGSQTVNGVFRAVYEADKAGSNMAMAY